MMGFDEIGILAPDLVAAARGELDSAKIATLESLIVGTEPDIAIKWALDWSSEGEWSLPESLLPMVRRWGDGKTRAIWRKSAERALQHACQPGLAAA